jgi:hypothetical protein
MKIFGARALRHDHPPLHLLRPISASESSPLSRRRIASRFWWGVSFGLRPIFTPFATARARPSPVRARIASV